LGVVRKLKSARSYEFPLSFHGQLLQDEVFYLVLPNGVLSLSSPIIGKLMSVAPNTPIGPNNHLRDFTIIVFPRRAHH